MASEEEQKRERRGDSDVDASTSVRKSDRELQIGESRREHRCNRFLVSIFHVENWLVHPSSLIYEGRRLKKKP